MSLSADIPIYQLDNRLSISVLASIDWYDSNYVNYYCGIAGKQVNDSVGRMAYSSGDAVNLGLGVGVSYLISDNWSVLGIISRTKLDDSIVDSPLIDADYQDSAGIIFVRHF